MALNVGAHASGSLDSFQKFSISRFAYKHLFVVESKVGGADMPSLFVLRGTFPFNEVQTFPVERDSSNTYYPQIVDANDMEIEFYETMDNVVWNFFYTWYKQMFHSTAKSGVVFNIPSKFKHNVYMFRLDTMAKEGSSEFTRVFGCMYEGCFPKRISDYPLDMSDPTVATLSITFSVDTVRRMESGHGISEPAGSDRTGMNMNSNPNEGIMFVKESDDTRKQRADARWSEFETKVRTEQTRMQVNNDVAHGKSLAMWAGVLIKAGIQTGVNIGKREAYYLAYNIVNRTKIFSQVTGGVRDAVDFNKSL